MQIVKKAVILAAGFGSRVLSFTKSISKVMYPIIDKPTIQIIVEEALASGIEEIAIVVGINKQSIISHFKKNELLENKLQDDPEILKAIKDTNLPNIRYIEQKIINGTAGATKLAKEFVGDEPFLLMFPDEIMQGNKSPVSLQLINEYYKTDKSIMACREVSTEEIKKYSMVTYSNKKGRELYLNSLTEKPQESQIISHITTLGRFVLKSEIFDYIDKIERTVNGEKAITSAFDIMSKENKVIGYMFDGEFYDIGNKLSYIKSVMAFAFKDEKYRQPLIDYLKQLKIIK